MTIDLPNWQEIDGEVMPNDTEPVIDRRQTHINARQMGLDPEFFTSASTPDVTAVDRPLPNAHLPGRETREESTMTPEERTIASVWLPVARTALHSGVVKPAALHRK